MAVTCDPSTLANNARCFTQCIPAGDQLAVQTYLIAQLALANGVIDTADAATLAAAASCFQCTIPIGDGLAAQNFLIGNALGLTDASALANLAAGFMNTVPWGMEMAVETYLLAQLTVGNVDPSTLANAARCWASCIPPGEHLAVQNYLWCQISPVCATPNTPVNLVASASSPTSINLQWSEPLGSPAGVTSFFVQWGTSAGNHTLGSASVSGNTPNYTITGLNQNTTYFTVVTAINGSCASAASTEVSATTPQCAGGLAAVSAWLTTVNAAGGTPPTVAVQSAMVDLWCGLSSDGILSQVLFLLPFPPASAGSNAAAWIMARTPFINTITASTTGTGSPQAAAEYTTAGARGDGASHFLDPGINPSTQIPQFNSLGWFAYCSVDGLGAGRDFGCFFTNGNAFYGAIDNAGNAMSIIGTDGTNVITVASSGAGFYSGQRVSSTNHRLYFANSGNPHAQIGATDAAANAASLPNLALNFFCVNLSGTGQTSFSTDRFSALGFTTGMTQAQNKLLFTRLDNFRRAVGGGFV